MPVDLEDVLDLGDVLGQDMVTALVGDASGDALTDRLQFLAAAVVNDLAGSYDKLGIRGWFDRPRTQLAGKTPREALGGNCYWRSETPEAQSVRQLAASLVSGKP